MRDSDRKQTNQPTHSSFLCVVEGFKGRHLWARTSCVTKFATAKDDLVPESKELFPMGSITAVGLP